MTTCAKVHQAAADSQSMKFDLEIDYIYGFTPIHTESITRINIHDYVCYSLTLIGVWKYYSYPGGIAHPVSSWTTQGFSDSAWESGTGLS